MLLRPQSTSIALTEDDLYYHLGRVISRSVELSAWFHNDNDSIDSHDGEEGEEGYDDGDDGIFTNSDSSLPDFPSESDCADSPCETSDDDRAPETQTHRTVIGMDPSSPALTRSSSSMASNLQSQHERLSRSTDDLPRIPLASSSENDPQAAVESHMVSMQKSPERASRRQSIEVSTGRQLNHSLALALRPVLAPSDQKWPRGLNHLNNPFSPLVFSPASSEPKIIALGAALKDLFSSNVVLLSWCPQHREEIEEFESSILVVSSRETNRIAWFRLHYPPTFPVIRSLEIFLSSISSIRYNLQVLTAQAAMKRDHSKVEGPFEEPSRTAPQADSAEASANPGPAPDVDLPRTPQRPIRRVRHLPERAARSRAVRRINQAASRNNPAQRIQPAQNTVPYLPGQDAIAGYQVVDANYATGYGNNVYHISQPLQLQYADVTPAEAYSMYPNQEANPPVQGGIVAAAMAQDPQPEQPPVHPVARDAALFQNYVNTLMEELDQGL